MNTEKTNCLIIGSGPAGYTTAIYAGRANLFPILYEGLRPGGQLTTTTEVENFPGFPDSIESWELMENMKKQAARFDAKIRSGIITDIDLSKRPYKVTIDHEQTIIAETIVIATGANAKYLGIPDEAAYLGIGVSACATCDGFFYRNKVVAVVGGGDSACEEALYLAGLASKVYLIVRKSYLRASKIMQQRVMEHEKVTILFNHNAVGLFGKDRVEGVRLLETLGPVQNEYEIPIDGFFLAIGHTPNSDLFKPHIKTDEVGYIITEGKTPRTNLPGIFAAGDVADPNYRQAITAAGSGCQAAIEVERFLAEEGII